MTGGDSEPEPAQAVPAREFRTEERYAVPIEAPVNRRKVAVFASHADAEAAVKELENAGHDMKKLSIAFGSGGREVAGRHLEQWSEALRTRERKDGDAESW